MVSWCFTVIVAVAAVTSVHCWLPDETRECYSGCPNGYFGFEDSCYVIPRVTVTWGQAVGYCRALDSELLTIETEAEQHFLEKEMKKHHGTDFWFAATDIIIEGQWRWAKTMSPVLKTFWKPGQPDNKLHADGIHHQHCAALGYDWHDENCKSILHIICERARL